jgi:hypothetical protein
MLGQPCEFYRAWADDLLVEHGADEGAAEKQGSTPRSIISKLHPDTVQALWGV